MLVQPAGLSLYPPNAAQFPFPSVMAMAMSAGQLLPAPVKTTETSMLDAAGLARASTSKATLDWPPESVAVWLPEMEHSQPNSGLGATQDPSLMVAAGS